MAAPAKKRFMGTRVFLMPISYGLSLLPLENTMIKFILIYSSFYVGNGIMVIIYLLRFRSESWKTISWR